MKAGRSATSEQVIDQPSAQVVAFISGERLARGFVAAFARACRDGVPTKIRQSTEVYSLGSGSGLIEAGEASRRLLTKEIERARAKKDRARRLALEATDKEERDEWVADRRKWAQAAQRMEHELAELERPIEPSASFSSGTDIIAAALTQIATARRFTQEEHGALHRLIRDFRVRLQPDGSWQASAVVRVATDVGVADLGPITWQVGGLGLGTQALRAARPSTRPVSSGSVREMIHHLEADLGLTREASLILASAPYPELAQIVLHELEGTALPEWVGPEWRDRHFNAHIATVYTAPDFTWIGTGQYTRMSPWRQAVVDIVAGAGGSATIEQIQQVLPRLLAARIWMLTRPSNDVSVRRWHGPLTELHMADGRRVGNVVCWCGELALTVARAPEIPRDLLCPNGHIPDATDPDERLVTFPAAYQTFRLTRGTWEAHTKILREPDAAHPRIRGHAKTILGLLTTVARPMSVAEVASKTGIDANGVRYSLTSLTERGLLLRIDGSPIRWRALAPVVTSHTVQETGHGSTSSTCKRTVR